MLILLSQKMNSNDNYSDELYHFYRYPAKYRNNIHEGDTFIYYQGSKVSPQNPCFFGIGTVGRIQTADNEFYCAQLTNCLSFEKVVSIYLPNGEQVEKLGDITGKSANSPIRPISQVAYNYILNMAGRQILPPRQLSIDTLNHRLKDAIRDYYLNNSISAIYRIESISSAIGHITNQYYGIVHPYRPSISPSERVSSLVEYCQSMKMSYSYKPVLILSLMHAGKNGTITIDRAAEYVKRYYEERKKAGQTIEKKRCIYLRESFSHDQVVANLISNPVKALSESDFFYYNEKSKTFSFSPEIWENLDRSAKSRLTRICHLRLDHYYSDC